jgi:hypothetical protein
MLEEQRHSALALFSRESEVEVGVRDDTHGVLAAFDLEGVALQHPFMGEAFEVVACISVRYEGSGDE